MSMYSSKRGAKKPIKSHLGHLKLSICEDSSALVVTIYEARGLRRKDGAPADTYVKLYLMPDPTKQTKEKTRRVKEKDPIFNQKFNFILDGNEDLDKSLFISVWNRDRTSRSEMIGCMSFQVQDLIGPNREVHGWYQLLDDVKGRMESTPVPEMAARVGSWSSLSSNSSATVPRSYAVTMIRGPKGYGFKVSIGTPVFVTEVHEGLPAHMSELKVGDMILEVEEIDVTRADGDFVVSLVKKQRQSLHLVVQRNVSVNALSPYSTTGGVIGSTSLPFLTGSYTDLPGSTAGRKLSYPVGSSQMTVPERNGRHFSVADVGGLTQPIDTSSFSYDDSVQWLRSVNSSRERMALSKEKLPEVPEEANSQSTKASPLAVHFRQASTGLEHPHKSGVLGHATHQSPTAQDYPPPSTVSSGMKFSFSQPSHLDGSYSSLRAVGSRKLSLGSPEGDGGLFSLAMQSVASGRAPSYCTSQSSSHAYQPRSLYSSKVSNSSVESDSDSAYVTGHSSRSLNHEEGHCTSPPSFFPARPRDAGQRSPTALQFPSGMLENGHGHEEELEEEMEDPTIDWDALSRLEQKRQRCINRLLVCEKEFADELRKGIDAYLVPLGNGILSENSHRTIFMNLDRMYDLSRYFYTQLQQRTLTYSPSSAKHVPFFFVSFADIYHRKLLLVEQIFRPYLRNSDNSRKEIAVSFTNREFTKIVQELALGDQFPTIYSFVEAGSEYLQKMSRLMVAIGYLTPPSHSDQKYLPVIISTLMRVLPASCQDLVHNWENENEMMQKLKMGIAFGNGVKPFSVIVPGRILLHEGEVQLVERKKKKKVMLLLFSDILLLLKKSGRSLLTLEAPLALESLVVSEQNCEVDEFRISIAEGTSLWLFKAPNVRSKNEWMQKVKERATEPVNFRKAGLNKQQSELADKDQKPAAKKPDYKKPEVRRQSADSLVAAKPPLSPSKPPLPHSAILNMRKYSADQGLPRVRAMTNAMSSRTISAPNLNKPPHQLNQTTTKENSRLTKVSTLSTAQTSRPWKLNFGMRRRSLEFCDAPSQPETVVGMGFTSLNVRKSLFNVGSKSESKEKKKKKQRNNSPQANLQRVSRETLKQWSESFDIVLHDPLGLQLFEEFLRKEYSDENILFWKACQRYKDRKQTPDDKLQTQAEAIFAEYISSQAPNMVNVDHTVTEQIMSSITSAQRSIFDSAEQSIYMLMYRDSFSRFISQQEFKEALIR